MLYMIIETFHSGRVRDVYRRFEEKGRQLPDGVRFVASWIDADLTRCFQVMECDARELLDLWMSRWEDLVDFEVIPVVTSEEAQEGRCSERAAK